MHFRKTKATFSFSIQKQREITAGVSAIGVSKDLIVAIPSVGDVSPWRKGEVTSSGDQHQNSPTNTTPSSNIRVMRIEQMVT